MRPIKLWYALVAVVITVILMAGLNIIYTGMVANRLQHEEVENDQKFCDVFGTLDGYYRDSPPKTPAGIEFAAKIHELTVSLGCQTK